LNNWNNYGVNTPLAGFFSTPPFGIFPVTINIRKLFAGSGFLIVSSEYDTTNIVCQFGHIYASGNWLIASMTSATPAQSRVLRRLGKVVMDGDFGELSVAFSPSRFREVARIMKPRQACNADRAA
jgi:hypothetical protein